MTNPTPTKIEPWMIEAAKEYRATYRAASVHNTCDQEDERLASIIARHAAAPKAKTQEVLSVLQDCSTALWHAIEANGYKGTPLHDSMKRDKARADAILDATPLADKAATKE